MMTEKEKDTSPPQSLMGETPKIARAALEDLSVEKTKILSLFQVPGFRHGVNLKSKI